METVQIDFNARDERGIVSVRPQRLPGAMLHELVNVNDPDGELRGAATVVQITDKLIRLRVDPLTIRDRPQVSTWVMDLGTASARRATEQHAVSRTQSAALRLHLSTPR